MASSGFDAELRGGRRWYRMAAAVAAAVILVCTGIFAGAFLARDTGDQPPGTAKDSPSGSTAGPTRGMGSQSTQSRTPMMTQRPTTCPTVRPRRFGYQPLWPFTSLSDVAAWQSAYRRNGSQPWHLDADQTAKAFTTGFLGFTEIDKVVGRTVRGDNAWVSVGFVTEDMDRPFVSAVIHLVKYGAGQDAPWEVVGTRDSELTLTTPAYGAWVSSPVQAGGRITGVDESILVEIRQPASENPIGTSQPVRAGGERQPWKAAVSFRGATDPALTVVARTGGHLKEVERFAVTAIRPR